MPLDNILPEIGAPFTEPFHKDGETKFHRIDFTIPFKLESKDEYLIWLREVLITVRKIVGRKEGQYILTYLIEGKEAADEWLNAEEPDQATVKSILFHCKRIAYTVLSSGINQELWNQAFSLEGWREGHWANFKLNSGEFVRYLTKWGNQQRSDEAKRHQNTLKILSYNDANRFTSSDISLMRSFETYDVDPEELVKMSFRASNVTSVNLADRVTEDFSALQSLSIFETSDEVFRERNGLDSNEADRLDSAIKGVQCAHCKKPNHEEDECWVKYSQLELILGTKRKATDDDCKDSKKPKNQKSKESPVFSTEGSTGVSWRKSFVWSTGSQFNIVNDWDIISDFVKAPRLIPDRLGNLVTSEGYGKVRGTVVTGEQIVLENVYYVKSSPRNIITGTQAIKNFPLCYSQATGTLMDKEGRAINDSEDSSYISIPIYCELHRTPPVKLTKAEKRRLKKHANGATQISQVGGSTNGIQISQIDESTSGTSISQVDEDTNATRLEKDLAHHVRYGHPSAREYVELRKVYNWLPKIPEDIRKHCEACSRVYKLL